MRGQPSVPGSGRRLVIWRPPPPLALPAPPGHVPQRLDPSTPRRSRLVLVWSLLGAAVIGFLGANALIPATREADHGTVIASSFVDGDGRWRPADASPQGFRETLAAPPLSPAPVPAQALVSVADPPAPAPERSQDDVAAMPPEAPARDLAAVSLPPDVRQSEPAAGAGETPGDDTAASLVRLAATLERPIVAAAAAGESAASEPAARGPEPRLTQAIQPVPPPPRRPGAPTEGSGARIIDLPQMPEPRQVAVARVVPPPDGFATQAAATGPVARQATGNAAWMRHARPFEAGDTRPRIALVVTDLGLSQGVTDQAIHYLPGAVTLSFNPFADNLPRWVEQARRAGHEVLINLPPETGGGVRETQSLGLQLGADQSAANQSGAEAAGRLEWALNRSSGYVGVASFLGPATNGPDQTLRPILTVLRDRGFIFVGRQPGARTPSARLAQELGVPYAAIDRQIDADPAREAIEQRLAELERAARENGTVVAMLRPHSATFERVAIWQTSLETKGIALAPITAVLNRQRNR